MNFRYGDRVRSTIGRIAGESIRGTVVGFGTLTWPWSDNQNGDELPQAVYLVRVAEGSSSLGPACVPMRADRVEEDL